MRHPANSQSYLPAALMALALGLSACAAGDPPPGMAEAEHPLEGTVWALPGGRQITPGELAAALDRADVAILGEVHDNATHHARQAWLVRRIEPTGVAFEMVPEASEEGIAVFLEQGGTPGEIGPAIGWDKLGWPDWEIYAPIFTSAPGAGFTGGGVPTEDLKRAIRSGAAVAFGPDAEAAGLTLPLPEAQQVAAEAEMVASHCDMLPASAAPGMVEAQRLRDARFAEAVARARDIGGGQAVLITGNGHARTDRGVPIYLTRLVPGVSVLSVGQVEVRDGAETLDAYGGPGELPFDFVWFSERAARGDPCESFRSG